MQPMPLLSDGLFWPLALVLLALATMAAGWLSIHLRPYGQDAASLDAEALAVLAGGACRHADAVIAELRVHGALTLGADGRWVPSQPTFQVSPAGRALLAAGRPFLRKEAEALLSLHAGRIAAGLRRDGLLLDAEAWSRLRLYSALPYAALFLAGLYAQRQGWLAHQPPGPVIAIWIVTAALAALRYARCDPRTRAGIGVVERAKAGMERGNRSENEAAMATALFGASAPGNARSTGYPVRA